jgi:hypothetical protein
MENVNLIDEPLLKVIWHIIFVEITTAHLEAFKTIQLQIVGDLE